MGRYKQAPWGFDCPYKHDCPHLGMSALWASLEIQDARRHQDLLGERGYTNDEYVKELQARNKVLEAENAELRNRQKQEHRLKFKANKKTANPPRTDGTPRKRGAPKGHPPWRRAVPDRVDRTVHVEAPTVCPHCHHEGLQPSGNCQTQIQEDIVLQPKTVVTEYIHQKAYCPNCRRDVFKTAEDEVRNGYIGPVTKAAAVYLRHEVKLSYRDVRKVFDGLFGMPFVPASAMSFSRKTARAGALIHEDLRSKVRAASIIHADETHWRIDGENAQLWYAGNQEFDFFHADYSRGAEVAIFLFGSSFGGSLVADSYAGYNAIHPLGRQACLAHLKRKADEIAERIQSMPEKYRDEKSHYFCQSISRFTSRCCAIGQRRNVGKLPFRKARSLIPRLTGLRDEICLLPLRDADAENLRQRITDSQRDGNRLFTFLEVNGMAPTNNHAERALRLPVIFRKISFGSRSLEGAQNLAVNLSLLGTAKRQKIDPINLFKSLLIHGDNTPTNILFQTTPATDHNSS